MKQYQGYIRNNCEQPFPGEQAVKCDESIYGASFFLIVGSFFVGFRIILFKLAVFFFGMDLSGSYLMFEAAHSSFAGVLAFIRIFV